MSGETEEVIKLSDVGQDILPASVSDTLPLLVFSSGRRLQIFEQS